MKFVPYRVYRPVAGRSGSAPAVDEKHRHMQFTVHSPGELLVCATQHDCIPCTVAEGTAATSFRAQ